MQLFRHIGACIGLCFQYVQANIPPRRKKCPTDAQVRRISWDFVGSAKLEADRCLLNTASSWPPLSMIHGSALGALFYCRPQVADLSRIPTSSSFSPASIRVPAASANRNVHRAPACRLSLAVTIGTNSRCRWEMPREHRSRKEDRPWTSTHLQCPRNRP